jgi:hypothetical protein
MVEKDDSLQENGWEGISSVEEEMPVLEDEEQSIVPKEFTVESEKELSPEQAQSFYQRILKMTVPQRLRLALMGNRMARSYLIRDSNKGISLSVLRNAKLTESEVLSYAQQRNLPDEVLGMIAKDKSWAKNYMVKMALVTNPKTPLAAAMRFISHLHERDLRALARNKNISSVLSQTAGRELIKRNG